MAANFAITGNMEILQIAESVAREKGVQRESVIEALEQAISIAGRKKYGTEQNIRAEIDRKTGGIALFRLREVVESVENPVTQISEKDAKLGLGEFVQEPLPPIDFGRVTAQTAKQVIVQKVRDVERDKQFEDYQGRVGEIMNGTVKRVEYGNITVDLGRTEAVLRREEIIPREIFRQNDRVRAYIMDVRREKKGPQIFLSRTHPQFMAKLFAQEVPEIYDGIIEIKAVARDPGSRAKIAVYSRDPGIDPVGSCVGVRGSRVQAVVAELQGEKINIIEWSEDPANLVVNALAPSEVSKIVIDEENHRVEVVVPDDQLSLAIGRRGQNVRLASQLLGWNIDVMTEDEESKRRQEEFHALSKMFVEGLNVEEVIAHLLATEGFRTIEEVAFVSPNELSGIQGFDEAIAEELQTRAKQHLEEKAQKQEQKWKDLGVAKELRNHEGITAEIAVILGEKEIKTLDDFADLASDELKEMLPKGTLSREQCDAMIMAARAHWFDEAQKK